MLLRCALTACLVLLPTHALAAPPDAWRDSPQAVRATAWRDAGIGLVVVGVIVGAGATAIGLLDPCESTVDNDCRASARRDAAIALGVPGAAILTGGIVSLSVGQSRLARLRPGVTANRRGFGLGLAVQF